MGVVTRIPPSPTGMMHIGTARTALYNYLYARHHNGTFLLRIEDTDRARYSEEAVDAIMNGLKWLEMEWDGDVVSQFEGRDRHAAIAREMVEKGVAYYCYCSPEELEEMREKAKAEGKNAFYDRRWRDKSADEAPEGVKPVIRIKAPLEGETVVHDKVQGDVTLQNDMLDDFIILRSDGTPTYMLSVVVDDHEAGVTHVIRGDDHLNNAFRQNIIYDAMGWDKPVYAHLPLILGPDGAKLSKRHGAQSVEEYADMGYLPEAMCNYLLRLGWSHGDEEIIPREKAIEWFDLDHVGKSAARFDFAKLESLNAHYIKEADDQRLLDLVQPFIKKQHGVDCDETAQKRIMASMEELKDRAKTLIQLADESAFYAKTIPYDFDEKATGMLSEDADAVLELLLTKLGALGDFNSDNIMATAKEVADELRDGKLGKVGMPLRAALTGTTVSPSIFHAAEILGKEETLARLQFALEKFGKNKDIQTASAN